MDAPRELNEWLFQRENGHPQKVSYYFEDDAGGHWCICLRKEEHFVRNRLFPPPSLVQWDIWRAHLVRCLDSWDPIWDHPDSRDLLKEEEHIPGIRRGLYEYNELAYLMCDVIETVRKRFPGTDITPNKDIRKTRSHVGRLAALRRRMDRWRTSGAGELTEDELVEGIDALDRLELPEDYELTPLFFPTRWEIEEYQELLHELHRLRGPCRDNLEEGLYREHRKDTEDDLM